MAKKSIKEEIREILAEDFVGPPLPKQGMAGPFAADYVNAPPGYEPAPTEPLSWIDREVYNKGIAPFPQLYEQDYLVPVETRQEAHPASGYYGRHGSSKIAPAMGSRNFFPGLEQVPIRLPDEFSPPPTISNEEQEIIDSGKDDLSRAIMRALQESKKGDK